MVVHVALDGIDGCGKTTQVELLQEFLTKKSYKVRTATQPINDAVLYILNNYNLTTHEIALLMAFDRSFSYYGEDWEKYDIVIWDRSILSSYAYNTDDNVPPLFIKQINKFFPDMDLYIIIESDTILKEQDYTNTENIIGKYKEITSLKKNIKTTPFIIDEPYKIHENIVKILFDNLPTCNWCGRIFTKTTHNKKYCSKKCKKYSLEDQYRINNRKYYHRYKDVMTERQKGGLGSKGANLHGTPDENPLSELQKVRNAKRALGLKPIQ